MRYLRGNSRHQQSFLSIDDQIGKSNVVRLIDEICEQFCETVTIEKGLKDTGRKAYHPADLMKILVYGYFNGLSSSRKLEREVQRNIELKWLTSDLVPDHKTISDFRKDNPELIDSLFKYLIGRFKKEGLVTGKAITVDGTKVKAYASRELNIDWIRQKLDGIEQQIEKYLKDIDVIDRHEDDIEELENKRAELQKELEELAAKKKDYQQLEQHLQDKGLKRISTTDTDSKVMKGRNGTFWGFNAQAAVDTQSHIITSIKVSNNQNDKGLLTPMVEASQENTGEKVKEVSADAGYYKINEIEKLEEQGVECYVAINVSQSQVKDKEQGLQFTYLPEEDRYLCGEGRSLKYFRKKENADGKLVKVYKGTECHHCSIREKCTNAEQRSVHRNENQEYIESYIEKMNSPKGKNKLKSRKTIAEHPFGTIKYSMGQIPLLVRGKQKVQTEMNLYAIGYNLKRYLKIKSDKNKRPSTTTMRMAA